MKSWSFVTFSLLAFLNLVRTIQVIDGLYLKFRASEIRPSEMRASKGPPACDFKVDGDNPPF